LILHCVKSVRKRLGGLAFSFLGTNTREMISESRTLGVVFVATLSLTIWGF